MFAVTIEKTLPVLFAAILFVSSIAGQSPAVVKKEKPREKTFLSYGIVVDNSGSYRMILETVIRSANQIIEANTADDKAFLVRFVDSGKISLMQDFTFSKAELHSAVEEMFIEGGQTAVLDAVYFSAKHLAADKDAPHNQRKALILITDGEDRKSASELDAVLDYLKDEKIQVYTLGISEGKVYRKILEKLAKETGGKSFIAEKSSDIETNVKQLTAALRAR